MLSSNDNERWQTFDRIETYPYWTTNEMLRVFESKENTLQIWMINFDDYVNENKTEHNKDWLYIPDKPYRIVIAEVGDLEKKMYIEFNRNLILIRYICMLKIRMKQNISI